MLWVGLDCSSDDLYALSGSHTSCGSANGDLYGRANSTISNTDIDTR
jgi:hypothetical protein